MREFLASKPLKRRKPAKFPADSLMNGEIQTETSSQMTTRTASTNQVHTGHMSYGLYRRLGNAFGAK